MPAKEAKPTPKKAAVAKTPSKINEIDEEIHRDDDEPKEASYEDQVAYAYDKNGKPVEQKPIKLSTSAPSSSGDSKLDERILQLRICWR